MAENWQSLSDDEVSQDDKNDEEENCYTSGMIPKLQFRKVTSKAQWIDQLGMAEVVEKKGSTWATTGLVREGKTYCLPEEILYLARIGALILLDESDKCILLTDMYNKLVQEQWGCCLKLTQAYSHLKSLGYVVGRHGIPWTNKSIMAKAVSNEKTPDRNELLEAGSDDKKTIVLFNDMQLNELSLDFDVYLPNCRFRKSSPGDPSFVLCLSRDHPPSKTDLEHLERQSGSVPLKFCHVEGGRLSFFSFDKVDLPVLP